MSRFPRCRQARGTVTGSRPESQPTASRKMPIGVPSEPRPLIADATFEVTVERRDGGKPACWVEWIARGWEHRTRPGPGCSPPS